VTAGQPLDTNTELSQSFLREVNLAVFEGIFVATAHQERELTAIGLKEATQVEPITFSLVILYEPCCSGKKEKPISAVQGAMDLAYLASSYVIIF